MYPPLITLTTDFGTADGYAAQMKGVLRGLVPEAVIDELSHDIPPHDVMAGALFLESVIPRYPEYSVHVAVVDPGVGTARRAIIVNWRNRLIVGPDNGLVTLLLRGVPVAEVYAICQPCRLPGVPEQLSVTFHGRDLFAPVAAYLARGGSAAGVGLRVSDPVCLPVPQPELLSAGGVAGVVIHVDRFGNAVTNIHRKMLEDIIRDGAPRITVDRPGAGPVSARFVRAYGEGQPGELLALINSGDRLELAVSAGQAARQWSLAVGARVTAGLAAED